MLHLENEVRSLTKKTSVRIIGASKRHSGASATYFFYSPHPPTTEGSFFHIIRCLLTSNKRCNSARWNWATLQGAIDYFSSLSRPNYFPVISDFSSFIWLFMIIIKEILSLCVFFFLLCGVFLHIFSIFLKDLWSW